MTVEDTTAPSDRLRWTSVEVESEDDPLVQLYKQARQTGAIAATKAPADPAPPEVEPPLFDVEIAKPRVINLDALKELVPESARQSVDLKSTEDSKLVLIVHGITPFHPPGASRTHVWGLGYTAKARDTDGVTTVDFAPTTEVIDLAKARQNVQVLLGLDGQFSLPPSLIEMLEGISELSLPNLKIAANASTDFKLGVEMSMNVVKVQAGPIMAGGVRWNIYQQNEPIDVYHQLLQTAEVPKDATSITYEVSSWVRSRGLFGTRLMSKQWNSDPIEIEVQL